MNGIAIQLLENIVHFDSYAHYIPLHTRKSFWQQGDAFTLLTRDRLHNSG
jgi:hypothetical protein